MRFIDANVFIYTLTKSPRASFEASLRILKRIEAGEEAITSTAVIQEIVDWLEYNDRRREVKAFLIAVNSYVSLRKAVASWEDMLSALDHLEADDIDYIDALTLQLMKKNSVVEIYSNDRDFDRVEWVRRIWE
ncbi:MAG: type II toxin-antitoxin system VapC family toxin [Candidatus Bathyarchaeia archaeon]